MNLRKKTVQRHNKNIAAASAAKIKKKALAHRGEKPVK
jgi:hypothetical protein